MIWTHQVAIEADLFRLVKLLEVQPKQLARMVLLMSEVNSTIQERQDLEAKRTEAIALCKRRIQVAIDFTVMDDWAVKIISVEWRVTSAQWFRGKDAPVTVKIRNGTGDVPHAIETLHVCRK